MKLHEEITPKDGLTKITRVAGGWIYRFWERESTPGLDGQWSENYRVSNVFVPYYNEFQK